MRISDWSSDVCSSDLSDPPPAQQDLHLVITVEVPGYSSRVVVGRVGGPGLPTTREATFPVVGEQLHAAAGHDHLGRAITGQVRHHPVADVGSRIQGVGCSASEPAPAVPPPHGDWPTPT